MGRGTISARPAMSHLEDFRRQVDALARAAGLATLRSDDAGRCELAVGERFGLAISLDEACAGVVLSARLGPVPSARREFLYARMLSRNLFPDGLDMAFVLDRDQQACLRA